ncbi:MAG: hypothetical protein KME38_01710 [Spirirestis rafaelensis WJT71-NPBG6]|nr:hypothetical protein [Spirirestis rafaelensis WJT71-NPBG6]
MQSNAAPPTRDHSASLIPNLVLNELRSPIYLNMNSAIAEWTPQRHESFNYCL